MNKVPLFTYKPLYLSVKEEIKKRIVDGMYTPGSAIPSETALAKEFELSISTIRQALSVLVAEERLIKKQGKGTFVSQKKIELSFFTWLPETQYGEKVVNSVIQKVEQKYPELRINIIPTKYPQAKNDLLRLISEGNAPDIVHMVSHWTSYFANMGTLTPLDDILNKEYLKKRSYEKDLFGGQWHKKQYSVSWGLCPLAIIANKQFFKGVNFDPQRFLSIKEFTELCQYIQNNNLRDDQAVYGFCLSNEETDFLRLLPFLFSFNGTFVNEDGKNVLSSKENIRAFRWLKSFIQNNNVMYSDIFDLRKKLADKEIAMISDGPWIKLHLEELTGEPFEKNFEVLLIPANAEGISHSWNYNHCLGVTSQSKYYRYAAKVIDCLSSDKDISSFYYKQVGHLPVIQEDNQKCIFDEKNFYLQFKRQLENSACINSQNALFEKAMDFCIDAVQKIFFQNADIEKELEEKRYYLDILYKN